MSRGARPAAPRSASGAPSSRPDCSPTSPCARRWRSRSNPVPTRAPSRWGSRLPRATPVRTGEALAGRRDHRVPRARRATPTRFINELSTGHAPHRRARVPGRARAARPVPRRAHRRHRAARDRGVRSADHARSAKSCDASLLVIEHDMPLVMGDQRPHLLPRGGPRHQRGHSRVGAQRPRVIASYLGTDEQAIARSGVAAPTPPIADPTPGRV